ncbi:MAG TPA: ceramidase domain-containing protein [Leptospiraceae bacterium]|nr:ceramidase domain-containing protein [Leptospiraceae bacterium]HMY67335.1 ceramidase domain-containing protein [Leptospiraceae bacterium]HNI96590.1 ceramidase domain-containing protein [Leptospiraceae bacterium]HNN05464.1 ceramidase domain-containing protein [Leptospiraceae bacterium]
MNFLIFLANCPWDGFAPPTIKYCENNLCSWITQPSNTWSNLIFYIAGILLFRNIQNRNNSGPQTSFLYINAFLIGTASFLYHASFTFLMQFFDLSSMYMFSVTLLCLNFYRMGLVRKKEIFTVFLLVLTVCMGALYFLKPYGIPIFALTAAAAIGTEFIIFRNGREKADYSRYKIGLILILSAFLFWALDFRRIWICDPDNHLFQGHAVWHILSGAAYYQFAMFFIDLQESE